MFWLGFPVQYSLEVFFFLAVRETDCARGEVPQEANEWHCGAEGNVFCLLPWNAQFIGQGVDVGHAVGVFAIFFRSVCNKGEERLAGAGLVQERKNLPFRDLGEVLDSKRGVLIELLREAVRHGSTSEPEAPPVVDLASVVSNFLGPLPALEVV